MVGNALPGCTSRGYNAPAPYPINIFQANPYGAGSQMRQLTDEASSSTTRCSSSSASATASGCQPDGELHLRPLPHRPLHRRRRQRADYHTAARQGTRLGPDGVRPAAHVPGLRHLRHPVRQGSAVSIENGFLESGDWRLVGVRHRAHPDRPSVPADERPPDAQPGGRRRGPQRHHRQGSAEDDERRVQVRTATFSGSTIA